MALLPPSLLLGLEASSKRSSVETLRFLLGHTDTPIPDSGVAPSISSWRLAVIVTLSSSGDLPSQTFDPSSSEVLSCIRPPSSASADALGENAAFHSRSSSDPPSSFSRRNSSRSPRRRAVWSIPRAPPVDEEEDREYVAEAGLEPGPDWTLRGVVGQRSDREWRESRAIDGSDGEAFAVDADVGEPPHAVDSDGEVSAVDAVRSSANGLPPPPIAALRLPPGVDGEDTL